MDIPFNPIDEGWKQLNVKGYFSSVGPLWSRKTADSWEYGMSVETQHLNGIGVAHGGMLVTLMDQAISLIAWDAAGRAPCATIQLDTHFVASAIAGNFIVAHAEVTRQASTLIFLRGTLSVGDQLIMTAQGLMKVKSQKNEDCLTRKPT